MRTTRCSLALLCTLLPLAMPRGELPAQQPRDRWSPLFVYDSAADRMLLFGGSFRGPDTRTWAWQGNAWTVVADSGPATRDDMAFAMMGTPATPIFFGGRGPIKNSDGQTLQHAYRETWRFELGRWHLVDTLGPEGRSGPSGVYDPIRKRFVVFGGRIGASQRGEPPRPWASGTWEWDGTRWAHFSGDEPPARAGAATAWDAATGMVIMHGGVRDGTLMTDTWGWNGRRWTQLATDGPTTAFGAATTWPDGGVVMFGGHRMDAPNPTATWHWNGKQWREVADGGPPPRTFSAMATDTRRERVYLIAGKNDFWYLGPDFKWVQVYPE